MYGGSGVAVAAPDEKLCPRTLQKRNNQNAIMMLR